MCGRFYQDLTDRELREAFGVEPPEQHPARYNVGPGQDVWVVRTHPDTHARVLTAVHWGLVPHFAKDRKGAYRCINARAETIERMPSYRTAFARRRCLVPVRGFFEWRKEGKRKRPFAIARADGAPLALAGIWENWRDAESGLWLRSVAIVTTEASAALRDLHDRMPVIVEPADFAAWLGEVAESPAHLKALLRPSEAALRIWPVSPRMNRGDVDEPSILEPASNTPTSQ